MSKIDVARAWADCVNAHNADNWRVVVSYHNSGEYDFQHVVALLMDAGADVKTLITDTQYDAWGRPLYVPAPDWLHQFQLGLIAVIEALRSA